MEGRRSASRGVAPVRRGAGMIRLAVRVGAADAELVLAELLELAPGGRRRGGAGRGDGRVRRLRGAGRAAGPTRPQAAAGDALVEVSTQRGGRRLGRALEAVSPPVLIDSPAPGTGRRPCVCVLRGRPAGERTRDAVEIVVDPGQAFGTGAHATHEAVSGAAAGAGRERAGRGPLLDVGTARACWRSRGRSWATRRCWGSTTTGRASTPPRRTRTPTA